MHLLKKSGGFVRKVKTTSGRPASIPEQIIARASALFVGTLESLTLIVLLPTFQRLLAHGTQRRMVI
jgi:hypothetical protein